MKIETLDYIFPFVIFGYGAIMTFVLNHPTLMRLAEEKLQPKHLSQFKGNRLLSLLCLILGGLWSLQNLWFKT